MELLNSSFELQLADILKEGLLSTDWVDRIFTFRPNTVNGDKIFILGESDAKSVEAGCSPTYDDGALPTGHEWIIKNGILAQKFCWTSFSDFYRGSDVLDAESVDVAREQINHSIVSAFQKTYAGLLLLGNTASSANSKYNLVNGLLTQAYSKSLTESERHTSIATNSKAALFSGDTTITLLYNLIDDGPVACKQNPQDCVIVMTDLLFRALRRNFVNTSNAFGVQEQADVLIAGFKHYTFDGYDIIVVPQLDAIIADATSSDWYYEKPGLAMLVDKNSALYASINSTAIANNGIHTFNDERTKESLADVTYSIGVDLASSNFQIAY